MLTRLTANPRGFLFSTGVPKGAVCQQGYSLEQSSWVNQTVPLSFYETRYNTN